MLLYNKRLSYVNQRRIVLWNVQKQNHYNEMGGNKNKRLGWP